MPDQPKFRAFLSYSHADEAMARYLHKRLEAYRLSPKLVGITTRRGPIPETLAPIFMDRTDFSGGHALDAATIQALDDSAALILLASPDSAHSLPVQREVETFQSRHPDRPVIPLILRGTAKDGFPPSLPLSTLAPDWREDNVALGPMRGIAGLLDRTQARGLARLLGWGDLAFAKLIAALVGIDNPDLFYQRERRRRHQRMAALASVAVLIGALAGGLGFFANRDQDRGVRLIEVQRELSDPRALAARLRALSPAAAQTSSRGDGLETAIADIQTRAASDESYARALALLQQGKPAEAATVLSNSLAAQEARVRDEAKERARQYRDLGAITALSDPARARVAYARAVELDPDNEGGLQSAGQLALDAADLVTAERHYRRLAGLPAAGTDGDSAWQARMGLGDVLVARGNLPGALASFHDGLTIADRRTKADPGNAGWRRDLSVSYNRIGDVLVAQGNLPEALKSFRDGLAIAESLAK
ncbi:MAG: toll/interleukin-1 receptor domain-containing protein, partial [Acetobacteraceae bacterium]|nr:toll/interleukin-1 receptor domain-containing protein [Acetobacteraceae bacterium]